MSAAQSFIDTPEVEPITDFTINATASNGTNATNSSAPPKPERVCKMVTEKRIRRVRLDVQPLQGARALLDPRQPLSRIKYNNLASAASNATALPPVTLHQATCPP